MDADANVRVVLEVFAAIEQRDAARFLAHTHPEVSICWPPSLPWNDGLPGRPDKHGHHARSWLEVWAPLQPTAAERQMHPEVIAAADDRVVVRWHQQGRSPTGLSFDGQVLGLYEVRQERLARAQMFYFDPDWSSASSPTPRAKDPQAGPRGRPRPADERRGRRRCRRRPGASQRAAARGLLPGPSGLLRRWGRHRGPARPAGRGHCLARAWAQPDRRPRR